MLWLPCCAKEQLSPMSAPRSDVGIDSAPVGAMAEQIDGLPLSGTGIKVGHKVYQHFPEFVENSAEELSWFNHALECMWPKVSDLAQFIAEQNILPKIQQKLANLQFHNKEIQVKDVHFSQFTLGDKSPIFGPVMVSSYPQGSVRVRVGFRYLSDMHMEVSMQTPLGIQKFGMKDLKIVGEMVFRLRPYIHSNPGVGGVSMFFINPPEIDFTWSGNAGLGNFPGIKEQVRKVVDQVASNLVVLPNVVSQLMNFKDRVPYPLLFTSPSPLGMLRLTLIKAVSDEHPSCKPKKEQRDSTKGMELPPPVESQPKSGGGGLFGSLVQVKKKLNDTVDLVEHKLAHAVGRSLDPHLKFKVGQQVWDAEVVDWGTTHDFIVWDPEQMLHITLWDRDLASGDDKIGVTQPMSVSEALTQLQKGVEFFEPHSAVKHEMSKLGSKLDEAHGKLRTASKGSNRFSQMTQQLFGISSASKRAGEIQLKAEWFEAMPGFLHPEGSIIIVRISEMRQDSQFLKDALPALRAKLGDEEKTTKEASAMKGATDNKAVMTVLEECRANLQKEGVTAKVIDKALDLSSIAKSRVAINRSLYFPIDAKTDINTLSIDLSLVDITKISRKHSTEEVLGTTTIKLSQLMSAPGLYLPGPHIFPHTEGGITADITIMLSGLKAADCPESGDFDQSEFHAEVEHQEDD